MMVYLLYMKQGISCSIFLTFLVKKGFQYTITLVIENEARKDFL